MTNRRSPNSRARLLSSASAAWVLVLAAVSGCSRTEPDPPPFPDRKITREELEQMDAEQRDDPYTQMNLERPLPGP